MFNFSDYVNDNADEEEKLKMMKLLTWEGKSIMSVN
jgi:hypothetical protein